jgi:hypothetical protein
MGGIYISCLYDGRYGRWAGHWGEQAWGQQERDTLSQMTHYPGIWVFQRRAFRLSLPADSTGGCGLGVSIAVRVAVEKGMMVMHAGLYVLTVHAVTQNCGVCTVRLGGVTHPPILEVFSRPADQARFKRRAGWSKHHLVSCAERAGMKALSIS